MAHDASYTVMGAEFTADQMSHFISAQIQTTEKILAKHSGSKFTKGLKRGFHVPVSDSARSKSGKPPSICSALGNSDEAQNIYFGFRKNPIAYISRLDSRKCIQFSWLSCGCIFPHFGQAIPLSELKGGEAKSVSSFRDEEQEFCTCPGKPPK